MADYLESRPPRVSVCRDIHHVPCTPRSDRKSAWICYEPVSVGTAELCANKMFNEIRSAGFGGGGGFILSLSQFIFFVLPVRSIQQFFSTLPPRIQSICGFLLSSVVISVFWRVSTKRCEDAAIGFAMPVCIFVCPSACNIQLENR
jgi:hypothetical protein